MLLPLMRADAMVGKLVELEAKGKCPSQPSRSMNNRQEGIITRIDAFVDMLVRKKVSA